MNLLNSILILLLFKRKLYLQNDKLIINIVKLNIQCIGIQTSGKFRIELKKGENKNIFFVLFVF
jgi:hypothetical protein